MPSYSSGDPAFYLAAFAGLDTQFELICVPSSVQIYKIFIELPFLFQVKSLNIQLMRSLGIFDWVMNFLLHVSAQDKICKIP